MKKSQRAADNLHRAESFTAIEKRGWVGGWGGGGEFGHEYEAPGEEQLFLDKWRARRTATHRVRSGAGTKGPTATTLPS